MVVDNMVVDNSTVDNSMAVGSSIVVVVDNSIVAFAGNNR